MNLNRRKFLRNGSIASLAIAATPFASTELSAAAPKKVPNGINVLFQGDSITDAGRDKTIMEPNSTRAFGFGYVFLTAAQLYAENYASSLNIYNKGISGHKVHQLAARWDEDAINLKPDVLSILIGINDYWHMVNGKYDGLVDRYEKDYRDLLTRTKKELPNVKIIICEPFAVWGGTAITDRWKKELPAYQEAAAKLAKEFNTGFVGYQKMFDEALKKAPASVWCPDGVHPSMAGAYLMAQAWTKEFNKLY